MKNILIFILFLNISNVTFAQTPVTDTIGYLRDSIEEKKTYYIGKPLSVLLNDLKIEVKSYMAIVPFDSEPNIIQFKVTSLQFYNNNDLVTRSYNHIISPHIDITFTPTIQIPKEKFKPGNVLDGTTGWTPEKAAFFGTYTISDLNVSGLGKQSLVMAKQYGIGVYDKLDNKTEWLIGLSKSILLRRIL